MSNQDGLVLQLENLIFHQKEDTHTVAYAKRMGDICTMNESSLRGNIKAVLAVGTSEIALIEARWRLAIEISDFLTPRAIRSNPDLKTFIRSDMAADFSFNARKHVFDGTRSACYFPNGSPDSPFGGYNLKTILDGISDTLLDQLLVVKPGA